MFSSTTLNTQHTDCSTDEENNQQTLTAFIQSHHREQQQPQHQTHYYFLFLVTKIKHKIENNKRVSHKNTLFRQK